MRDRPAAPIPVAVERVRWRFERWRRTRPPGRSRIPARLWAAAVTVARQHGVNATSRWLRLDYVVLKRRLSVGQSTARIPRANSSPTFIDLTPASGFGSSCVIELQSPCGAQARVQVPWATVADLVAFTRGIWGDGSAAR